MAAAPLPRNGIDLSGYRRGAVVGRSCNSVYLLHPPRDGMPLYARKEVTPYWMGLIEAQVMQFLQRRQQHHPVSY